MTEQTTASNSSATQPKRRRRRRGGRRRGGQQRQQTQRQSVDNWSLDQFQVPAAAGKVRFHDFNLPLSLMQAIHAQGFEYCTPIQAQSLHYTLHGVDLIGKAQTGTGKTAAFLISIMTYFLEEEVPDGQKIGAPRALIVAPTRELVMQIAKDANALAEFAGLNVVSVVGGMDYQKQRDQLRGEKIDLLVATPGRLLDFHSKRDLDLRQVEVLVLDEADRMLDMGFIPDVKRIIRATPRKEERQTMLFSATFTQDIMNLAEQWTIKPQRIEIASKVNASENIEQHAFLVSDSEKLQLMKNLLKRWSLDRVIIFANRRDITRDLHQALRQEGFNVALLSGEVDQKKRVATLERFRAGKVDVLVATDVAGRGLHIDDISHVINYTLPEDPEDYVHRIGRTGRAGAKGTSISFVGEEDAFAMPAIEQLTKAKLPCVYPPEELTLSEDQLTARTVKQAEDHDEQHAEDSAQRSQSAADETASGETAASEQSAKLETQVHTEAVTQGSVEKTAESVNQAEPVNQAESVNQTESQHQAKVVTDTDDVVSDDVATDKSPAAPIEDTSEVREVVQEVNEEGEVTGVKVTVEFETEDDDDASDTSILASEASASPEADDDEQTDVSSPRVDEGAHHIVEETSRLHESDEPAQSEPANAEVDAQSAETSVVNTSVVNTSAVKSSAVTSPDVESVGVESSGVDEASSVESPVDELVLGAKEADSNQMVLPIASEAGAECSSHDESTDHSSDESQKESAPLDNQSSKTEVSEDQTTTDSDSSDVKPSGPSGA